MRSGFDLFFIMLMLMLAAPAQADDSACNELIVKAEQAWAAYHYDGSDRFLDQAMKACPERSEIYWRKIRNEYDRIEAIPREKKPDKEALIKRYRAMEELADTGAAKDETDGNCLFWKGVAMGRRGTTQGILKSLAEVDDLETVLLKAEKMKPEYRSEKGSANAQGDIYTALGQFYRVVPEWLCVFPFKQMFGACGDLENSVAYQRKAVQREPKRIEYAKEMAISLMCYGQKKDKPEAVAEGKKILTELQTYPEIKPSDSIDKQHARMLVQDPSQACGYSRDAQQEQSRDAYKDK